MTRLNDTLKREVTSAAQAALIIRDNPEALPTGAPDPRTNAAGFAEWWTDHRMNKVVKLKLFTGEQE